MFSHLSYSTTSVIATPSPAHPFFGQDVQVFGNLSP